MTKFEKQLMEYIVFEKQFDGNIDCFTIFNNKTVAM